MEITESLKQNVFFRQWSLVLIYYRRAILHDVLWILFLGKQTATARARRGWRERGEEKLVVCIVRNRLNHTPFCLRCAWRRRRYSSTSLGPRCCNPSSSHCEIPFITWPPAPDPTGLCVYRVLTQTRVLSWFIARLYRTLYIHALRTSRGQEVCHKFIGAPLKHTWLLYCVRTRIRFYTLQGCWLRRYGERMSTGVVDENKRGEESILVVRAK